MSKTRLSCFEVTTHWIDLGFYSFVVAFKFRLNKILSVQKILSSKFFGPSVFLDTNILVKKNCIKRKCWSKKNPGQKNVRSKMLVPKSFGLKSCSVQKNLGRTKLWFNKIRAPKKLIPKILLKILSVTTDIFLVWTNVTMKNIASINVTMIVEIC